MRLQKAFERVYVVDCSGGFRDGVPDDWSSGSATEKALSPSLVRVLGTV